MVSAVSESTLSHGILDAAEAMDPKLAICGVLTYGQRCASGHLQGPDRLQPEVRSTYPGDVIRNTATDSFILGSSMSTPRTC